MSLDIRLRVTYAGFALDVDLSLPARGITALFGPSGSGKTTLLRAVAGLERVPGGYLRLGERLWQQGDYFVPPHRRPLGYVFQDAGLFPHLTVQDNLEYGRRRNHRRDVGADSPLTNRDHLVDLLGIATLLQRRPERLSGGERQRVAVARALLTRPRLLLMDEPLSALDSARKEELLPYLERLHQELSIPVLYVSHAPDEVARLADHLVLLESGRVLASGPLGETLARMDLPIRLGEDAGVVLEARVGLVDADWHLARVDFSGGDLWVRHRGHPPGATVRVRILARDVSIATQRLAGTSIQNTLPARVVALGDDSHPALCLVHLDCSGQPLLARLTRRSAALLNLVPEARVWAQIKAVALV
ncbi:MAG: molybdenum ABC transporter ATP-binding protein [Magnetococcus sp. WYHC-3]